MFSNEKVIAILAGLAGAGSVSYYYLPISKPTKSSFTRSTAKDTNLKMEKIT